MPFALGDPISYIHIPLAQTKIRQISIVVLILAKRKLGDIKSLYAFGEDLTKMCIQTPNTKCCNVKQGFPCISWLYRNEPHQWTVKSILLQIELIKMY